MRIGLDIDGPLAKFQEHLLEYYDLDRTPPTYWDDPRFVEWVPKSYLDKDFWMTIPRAIDPAILTFVPEAYVTARGVPSEWTQEWLTMNEFPKAKLVTVGHSQSKVEALKRLKIDLFLDDSYKNYREINRARILCVLFTQSHNINLYALRRVNSMEEFNKFAKAFNSLLKENTCS